MRKLTLAVAVFALSCAGGALQARTWYVNAGGTGDAPTIHAALDSAIAGDSVVVGPGTYTVDTTTVIPPSVVLISENGPENTVLQGPWSEVMDGIAMGQISELNGFWIRNGTHTGIVPADGGLLVGNIVESGLTVTQSCAIVGNLFVSGLLDVQGAPSFFLNIVMSPVFCHVAGLPGAFCNNFVGTVSSCDGLLLNPSNFSLDPQFCSPETGDYRLLATSPCAAGNHPAGGETCGQIGPLGVGCSPVPTREMSWGAVKALYSDGEHKE